MTTTEIQTAIASAIRTKNVMAPGSNRDHAEKMIDKALGWMFKGKIHNAALATDQALAFLAVVTA